MASITSTRKVGKEIIHELSNGKKLTQFTNNYGTKTTKLYNAEGDLIRRVEVTPHETGKFISTVSTGGKITHLPEGKTQYENMQHVYTNISDDIINGRKIRTIERTDAATGKRLSKIDIEI